MKKDENGFMLVETLIVSTLVSTILVVLYVQFNNIVNNFDKNFNYNNIGNLYAANNVKKFILQDNNGEFYLNLKQFLNENLENDQSFYLKIFTTCDNSNIDHKAYNVNLCEKFNSLTNFYNIKQILFVMNSVDLKDSDYKDLESPNFVNFIKNINKSTKNSNNQNDDYRIFIEFENNQFATLKMSD